jgi:hypothetical protein
VGFIVGLLLTAMAIYGLYRYAVSATVRAMFLREFVRSPGRFAVAFVGGALVMIFFWGVLIPPFGTIKVPISDHKHLELWQVGGIGAVTWMIVFWSFMQQR